MAPRKGLLAVKKPGAKPKRQAQVFGSKLRAADRKKQGSFENKAEERNDAMIGKARMDINKLLDEHPDRTVHFLFMVQPELSIVPKKGLDEEDPWFINQTTTLAKVPQTWLVSYLPTVESDLGEEQFAVAYDMDHTIAHKAACLAFNVNLDFRMKVMKYKPIFRRYMGQRYIEHNRRLRDFLKYWSPEVNDGKYPWHKHGVYQLLP